MISSAEIYKLAERHLGSDSYVFSDEGFDAGMNVVRGECRDNALEFIRAIIAANNAKVLKDLKPFDVVIEKDCSEPYGEFRAVPYYTADQVAALVQERDALSLRIKQLNAQAEHHGPVIVPDTELRDPNTIYGECFGVDWIYAAKETS